MNNLVQPIAKQAVNYRPAKDGTLEKQVVNMRFDNKKLRSQPNYRHSAKNKNNGKNNP